MKTREIKSYRQKLRDILKKEIGGQRQKELMDLAQEVGAGYVQVKHAGLYQTQRQHDSGSETITHILNETLSEAELVININNALQTETMINALNAANRSWIVAIVAAAISVIGILVAV